MLIDFVAQTVRVKPTAMWRFVAQTTGIINEAAALSH